MNKLYLPSCWNPVSPELYVAAISRMDNIDLFMEKVQMFESNIINSQRNISLSRRSFTSLRKEDVDRA